MIDLHCHVLPGVDDGAGDWAQAVEMCRLAAGDGCAALVATPHQRRGWSTDDPEQLRSLCHELAARCGEMPALHLGAEIHVDSQLLDDLARDDLGGLCPLAGTRWLLLELGQLPPAQGLEWLTHELRVMGWRPILAHPEFIPFLADDLDLVARLIGLGARAQVTAMSVTGELGRDIQDLVLRMIGNGLVHFIASDAHSPDWRPPGLAAARDVIGRRWSEALASRLTSDHPQAVIEDREVASDPLATG